MSNPLVRRLRTLRRLSGESARGVARLAGLSAAHLSLIENGQRPDPQASTVVALASVYSVSLDWLLRGRGPAFLRAPLVSPSNRATHDAARKVVAGAISRARASLARREKTQTANDNAVDAAKGAA